MDLGYDVSTIRSKQIPKEIYNCKILGIHAVNPLGWAFNTYLRNFLNEKNEKSKYHFEKLISNKHIVKAKNNGLKIIVGGQGAWQFAYDQEKIDEYNIDCVIVGEAELVIDDVINRLTNGGNVPNILNVTNDKIPDLHQISEIKHPSNSGCIEIGRGCPRHCNFCEVTKTNLRWYPLSKIQKELIINCNSGLNNGMLHAEDVFLYGQKSTMPDEKKIIKLIQLTQKYCKKIHLTHVSIASSIAIPNLIEHVMDLILQNQYYMLVEVGLETGSVNLLRKNMASKVKPFKPEQWRDLIDQALGKMHDNMMIPFCSIIFGLPFETQDDKINTLELIENIRNYRCILFPVNFIPSGNLNDSKKYTNNIEDLDSIEKEIVLKCIDHDLFWLNQSKKYFFKGSRYKLFLNILVKIWEAQYRKNVKKYFSP
jgi:radical SAM superfamily enzyme YgiQ (UPF0313 family)